MAPRSTKLAENCSDYPSDPNRQLLHHGYHRGADVDDIHYKDVQVTVEDRSLSGTRTRRPKASMYRRVGRLLTFLCVVSILMLSAVFVPLLTLWTSFLSWLWRSDRLAHNWRRIVSPGYGKQAVTISAIVIRIACSILAVAATSMIAAVALENKGVLLEDLAEVSIARFSNSGPEIFVQSLFSRKRFIASPLRILLLLLLTTSSAVQFTSTLLLWDFGQGSVQGFHANISNTVGFSLGSNMSAPHGLLEDSSFGGPHNKWDLLPEPLAGFGEYTESVTPTDDTIQDTGISLRSFLPFGDRPYRESVLEYRGVAPVFDTRVVCVRPNFTSLNISAVTKEGKYVKWTKQVVFGHLYYPDPVPARGMLKSPSLDFDCRFGKENSSRESLCMLSNEGGLISALDPVFHPDAADYTEEETVEVDEDSPYVFLEDDTTLYPGTGGTWLIMRANQTLWKNTSSWSTIWRLRNDTTTGAWTTIMIRSAIVEDFQPKWNSEWDEECSKEKSEYCAEHVIKTSLCFSALTSYLAQSGELRYITQDETVNMLASDPTKRNATREEPRIQYNPDLDSTTPTDNILKQLGVTAKSLDDRGVLELDGSSILGRIKRQRSEFHRGTRLKVPEIETGPWTVSLALSNDHNYSVSTWPDLTRQVFKDILDSTDSASLALQGVLTMLIRTVYYHYSPLWDYSTNSTVVRSELAFVPKWGTGLRAVMAIVSLHVILFFVALVQFWMRTKISLLTNVWQAVAHITLHPDATDVLECASTMTDREIAKQVEKEQGKPSTRLRRVKIE